MKAAKVLLFVAITAKHGLNLFDSDTKQAFLNWEIREDLRQSAQLIGDLRIFKFRTDMLCSG